MTRSAVRSRLAPPRFALHFPVNRGARFSTKLATPSRKSLPRIVGHANALDLLMSARRVSSEEALRIGLVNRLYPPDQLREQTYAYARDLADFVSPSAIAVIKRQLYDVPFQTLAEATLDANREMVVALHGSDFREGVASFMEKRPPRFTGK